MFAPIDIASIALFRISFGLLLLYDMSRYFYWDWIRLKFIDPPYHFSFFGFDFIRPMPGQGMYCLFAVLGGCALLIAMGLFYRMAVTIFFIGFAYIFLIDEALYLNHFYLVLLFAFLMIFVPAARGWSLDAVIARRPQDSTAPRWSLWLLRAQLEIVLIFAGVVKLNPDWLQGEPLGQWLAGSSHLPILGPWLIDDRVVVLGAWGVAVLHLVGAPLLLLKPTRLYVFLIYCVFHFLNYLFFRIGIFPLLTVAATLLFFDPSWPRTVWRSAARLARLPVAQAVPSPSRLEEPVSGQDRRRPHVSPAATVTLISIWVALQSLVPLRHHLYPGNVNWTEQGHNFAWQMMLRQKDGSAAFHLCDPSTGRSWTVDPRAFLTQDQYRKMVARPELIRRFARHLEKQWSEHYGTRNVEVRAITAASLNGRRPQALVDPARDLSEIGYAFGSSDWVVPLMESMPPREERWLYDTDVSLRAIWRGLGDSMAGWCR